MIRYLPAALALACSPALAQQADDAKAKVQRAADERLHTDWAWLGRYQAANARLTQAPDVVFIGDSITEGWIGKVPAFFSGALLDRGIGGQTTPQMLLRFHQDVIDLHPKVVQIMGGTNDIAGNTGPMTAAQTQANIMAMTELAQAHGIRVILASIPPADRFPWRPGLETVGPIAALNAWMKDYARRVGAVYADYWTTLHQGDALNPAWTYDGVHPNAAGYAAMAPVARAAIREALARPAPTGRSE